MCGCEYAFAKPDFGKIFTARKGAAQHWYNLSVGNSALHVALTVNTQKHRIGAEIYIPDDKEIYSKFLTGKNEIERELGMKLERIEAEKVCRLLAVHSGDIRDGQEYWQSLFDWFCDMAIKLRAITKKYGK